jgi:branched-chain amino acid transport system ATP-binding protein
MSDSPPSADAILRTEALTKKFGELTAVDDVDYVLREGELASLIGPNGAGKTTFINLITGEFSPNTGRIFLGDDGITGRSPHERVESGLGRVFQISNIFPKLSAYENVRLAVQASRVGRSELLSLPENNPAVADRTTELLEDLALSPQRETEAVNLSHGDKRRLEIGMALALEPRVLLLDEPMAGLTEGEVEEISELVVDIAERHTILLVEHKMDVVMELSDRISVLHQGRIIADGTVSEIRADQRVQEVYLGEDT